MSLARSYDTYSHLSFVAVRYVYFEFQTDKGEDAC